MINAIQENFLKKSFLNFLLVITYIIDQFMFWGPDTSAEDKAAKDQDDELQEEEEQKQAIDARDQAQKLRDLDSMSGGSSF